MAIAMAIANNIQAMTFDNTSQAMAMANNIQASNNISQAQTHIKSKGYNMYDQYRTLVQNPPKLNLLVGSKEFKLELISCMCDNRSTLTASIEESIVDGKVVRHGISLRYTFGSFSNIQCEYDYDDIKWAIEEALIDGSATAFKDAIRMLNSGTVKVASVKFRPIFKGGL